MRTVEEQYYMKTKIELTRSGGGFWGYKVGKAVLWPFSKFRNVVLDMAKTEVERQKRG